MNLEGGVKKVTIMNVGWEFIYLFQSKSIIYYPLPRHGSGKNSHVQHFSNREPSTSQRSAKASALKMKLRL